MTEFQWSEPYQAMMLTEDIPDAHPNLPNYSLQAEDVMQLYSDGTWAKVHPGTLVIGFVLSPEDVQSKMKPVWMRSAMLSFYMVGDVDPSEVDPDLTQVPLMSEEHGYDL